MNELHDDETINLTLTPMEFYDLFLFFNLYLYDFQNICDSFTAAHLTAFEQVYKTVETFYGFLCSFLEE